MATWQYDLHLLAVTSVLNRYREFPVIITPSDLDNGDWELSHISLERVSQKISQFLPVAQSWAESVKMWGVEDGNRIDVVADVEEVEDIYVRVDVRDISVIFLSNVVNIANEENCLILADSRYIVRPSVSKIMALIHKSDKYRFVVDPFIFLDRLRGCNEDESQ